MNDYIISKIKQILDWIYYKKCYFCGKISPKGLICDECFKEIKESLSTRSRLICNVQIFSIATYKDKIQQLIRGIKYHNKREFAYYTALFLYEFWQKTPYLNVDFEIIPMPLHKNRLRKRKFNHAELIAEEFSKLTGYPVNTQLVLRIKDTGPQYKLTKPQRMVNLKGAFEIKKENYSGKNLLLIDDICTTGATMQEMIKSFNKQGIDTLCGLVVSTPQ